MKLYSPYRMRKHLLKLLQRDPKARLLGIDIGRKYVGTSISNEGYSEALSHKTYNQDPQYVEGLYDHSKNRDIHYNIHRTIINRKIRGLIIGYPLDIKNQTTYHCKFVKDWISRFNQEYKIRIPLTYVHENIGAKAIQNQLININTQTDQIDPRIFFQSFYEKEVARIILQGFINYLMKDNEDVPGGEEEFGNICRNWDKQALLIGKEQNTISDRTLKICNRNMLYR